MIQSPACLEPLERRRLLSAGQLVPTFGSRGIVADTTSEQDNGAMLVLGDGKILISGDRGTTDVNSQPQLFLARYLPNGKPDTTFGAGGTIEYPNAQVHFDVADMKIDGSGRIVLAGDAVLNPNSQSPTSGGFSLLRLNADGSIDNSFGGAAHGSAGAPAGYATSGKGGTSHAMTINTAGDGRIAIVGDDVSRGGFTNSADTSAYVAMFNSDGSVDTNFAGDAADWGKSFSGLDSFDANRGDAVAFDSAGNVIVAGVLRTILTPDEITSSLQWDMESFKADGTLVWRANFDPRFTQFDKSGGVVGINDIIPMGNGSFLVVGGDGRDLTAARVSASGKLDTTFGNKGIAVAKMPPEPLAGGPQHRGGQAVKAALLPDNRFYVAGTQSTILNTGAPTRDDLFIARFTSDGLLDPTYPGPSFVQTTPTLFFIDLATSGDNLVSYDSTQPITGSGTITLREFQGGASAMLNSKGSLQISGSSGDDVISLARTNGRIVATINGVASRSFAPSLVKRIQIYSWGGNDTVTIGPNIRQSYVDGGAGNDTLHGGEHQDILNGGEGDDVIDRLS